MPTAGSRSRHDSKTVHHVCHVQKDPSSSPSCRLPQAAHFSLGAPAPADAANGGDGIGASEIVRRVLCWLQACILQRMADDFKNRNKGPGWRLTGGLGNEI